MSSQRLLGIHINTNESSNHRPGTVLGARNTAVNKTENPCPHEPYNLEIRHCAHNFNCDECQKKVAQNAMGVFGGGTYSDR